MKLRDWAAFLSLTFIWGASFFWIKIAVREVDPLTLVAFRLAFGLLGLVLFFPVLKPRLPGDRRTWISVAILGLTSSAIPWVFISWAETTIDSAIASVLNGTVPLFTILVAHVFLHDERITARKIIGLLVGFAGVVVLAERTPGTGGVPLDPASHAANYAGKGAMLIATLSYAVGAVHARRNLRGVHALVQAFFSMVFSLAVVLVVVSVFRGALRVPARVDTWIALSWLGILGAGIASFVFYRLLHSVGPTRASLVTYTLPVVGVALGVIILNERFDWPLVVGTSLIVSGVWVVNRG
jgi:drug/metabolite transporter (DMT)-like permease